MALTEKPLITRSDSRYIQPTLEEVGRGAHVSRELFGPGKSGERSYNAVISAREIIRRVQMGEEVTEEERKVAEMDSCSYPNPTDPNRCNGLPTGTVNYDVFGDEDITLVCSREHGDGVEKSIEEELRKQGRFTWPARNGWGRH